MRRNQQWDYIAEDAFFASSAIRCVSFDDAGYAWVGDDAGRVKVGIAHGFVGEVWEVCGRSLRAVVLLRCGRGVREMWELCGTAFQ